MDSTIAPIMLRRSLIFILHLLLLLSFGYEVGLVGWRDGSDEAGVGASRAVDEDEVRAAL